MIIKIFWGNPITYYCSLTHQHCVGAKPGFFIFSDDKIEPQVIERCPGKKTIDDILGKK